MRSLTVALAGAALFAASVSAPAAADRALGEYLSSACVTCHRIGAGHDAAIPSVAGMPADQFVALLDSYKTGVRQHQIMNSLAAGLSRGDMEALAEYFGSITRN